MKMIYNYSAELLVGSRQLLNNYNIYRYTTTTTIYTDIQLQHQYIQIYNYNNNIYKYTTTTTIYTDIQLQQYTQIGKVGGIGLKG